MRSSSSSWTPCRGEVPALSSEVSRRTAIARPQASVSRWASTLASFCRYLLSKAQVEQPAGNWVLLVLARTPLQGALELISDLLDAHAAQDGTCSSGPATAAAATAAGTEAAAGLQAAPPRAAPAKPSLVPGHGCALEQAADCLAALASNPDQLLGPSDSIVLHHFCCYLLDLACRPPQLPAQQPGSSLPTPQPQGQQQAGQPQGGAAADAPINISLNTAGLAHQLIARLLGSTSVGLMLLRAAAAAVRQWVLELVAAVTGEQVVAAPDSPDAGRKGLGLSQPGWQGLEPSQPGGEALDEDGIVHTVTQLAVLLHTALQLLPAWGAELGGCDDEFMRSLYQDIVDAKDACALISVTRGGIARQMQRAAVQVQAALQQMAAEAAERGYVYA